MKVKSKNKEEKKKLIVKPEGTKWYEIDSSEVQNQKSANASNTLETQSNNADVKPEVFSKQQMTQLEKDAKKLLDDDCESYKSYCLKGSQKSDFAWMQKMMWKGTLLDRMAAFTVRIQDSPVHNIFCLQQLIGLVKVAGKQQCLMTADTLRELFLEDLLPPRRKLIPFQMRNTSCSPYPSKKKLVLWLYEDQLKQQYATFVQALRVMAGDTIDKIRGKAISILYELLKSHPEQEVLILEVLVNKLGDPCKKVASRALFHLNKLLDVHSVMKMVVVREVERLLFRNNIGVRAQYYGICFLNTIKIEGEHPSLGAKLVKVYLAFFKACVKTGDIDSKLMSGLLTGINRAYQQAAQFGIQFTESLDTLYKIVQVSNFNIGIQALCILYQVAEVGERPAAADRFYRVLYHQLLDPNFMSTSHSMQLINLIFKAMKHDSNSNRITGYVKRLLQLCHTVSPNLACSVLLIISEVTKTHQAILKTGKGGFKRSENRVDINGDGDVTIESDESDENEDAFLKREQDLQKFLKSSNVVVENKHAAEKKENINAKKGKRSDATGKDLGTSVIDLTDVKDEKLESRATVYDPFARNPAYCGAELDLTHELASLSQHYHPSVALFAQTLLNKANIEYDGNPIKDFTLTRFLDRFVYRNPKQKGRPEYRPKGLRNVPVNSSKYVNTDEGKIPHEEKFFYKYFKGKNLERPREDVDSDNESVSDAEFEEIVKKRFGGSLMQNNEDDDDDDDDGDDEDVDFSSEVKQKANKGKKRQLDSDEDDDADEDDDISDDGDGPADDADEFEMDGEDDDYDDDDDDMGDIFEDDENDEELPMMSKKNKFKISKTEDMFAPADKFSQLLEANADEESGGAHTFINKDRAAVKQLKWEAERDRWSRGFGKGQRHQKNQSRGVGRHGKFKSNKKQKTK